MEQKPGLTQTEDILNSILPPREWTEDGQLWVQYVSSTPATRLDVITLQERLDQQLQLRQVSCAYPGWPLPAFSKRDARSTCTAPRLPSTPVLQPQNALNTDLVPSDCDAQQSNGRGCRLLCTFA